MQNRIYLVRLFNLINLYFVLIFTYLLIIIIKITLTTTMLILFETAVGFALFRCDKPKKLEKVENLQKYFEDTDGLRKLYYYFYSESL